MESVELARLIQIDIGFGLIPFVYLGCLVAAILQVTSGFGGRLGSWQAASLLLWLASTVITALKVVAVSKFGTTGPLAREDTAYSTSHQINDLAILAAFYALLVLFETMLMFAKRGRKYGQVENTGYQFDK
jgi:hypothetical protein